MRIMRSMAILVALAMPSLMANSSASGAVVLPAGALEDDTVMNLFLRVGNKNNSCIRETQENSIEFQVQSILPYILIPMVRANYCASYPK